MSHFSWLCVFYSVLIWFSSPGSCLVVSELTLEQKVGQILILGVSGQTLTPSLKSHLQTLRPGGIILFKKNLSKSIPMSSFTSDLQKNSSTPLFLALDQEGGIVNRLATTPPLPSAKAIGRANNPKLTEELGFSMGQILLSQGINMNLAPVLDIDEDGPGRFLRSRAYSSSAERVASIGVAFASGLLRAGVLPTAKHFPGIGSISGDSHLQTTQQTEPAKVIWNKHLLPFRKFSQLQPSAMMLSHASYPTLGIPEPAPFSKKISASLLRNKLSYKGLIITDDLMMIGAQKDSMPFQERVLKVFRGGSDMLLIAWSSSNQRLAQKTLVDAFKNGTLPMSELNSRVEKILQIKSWLTEKQQEVQKQKARNIASDPELNLKKILQKLGLVSGLSAGQ